MTQTVLVHRPAVITERPTGPVGWVTATMYSHVSLCVCVCVCARARARACVYGCCGVVHNYLLFIYVFMVECNGENYFHTSSLDVSDLS